MNNNKQTLKQNKIVSCGAEAAVMRDSCAIIRLLLRVVVGNLSTRVESRRIKRWRQQIANLLDGVRSVGFRRAHEPVKAKLAHTCGHKYRN